MFQFILLLFFFIYGLYYYRNIIFKRSGTGEQEDFFMRWKLYCTAVIAGFVLFQADAQNRRTTSYYEETVGNLTNQLRLMQDENAKLSGTVYTLQQEMRELKQRMQSYQAEISELRRMISAESEARRKQMGNIADKIQQAASQPQTTTRNQANSEEYDYYVVESGATLSAISRATGISIARLKQVNGMKNDNLRVGQKLKIPRK